MAEGRHSDANDGTNGHQPGAPDERHDLLAAYALDAVDDGERAAVDELIARDPDAAAEVAELHATASLLGAAATLEPPVGLRQSVLDQIARTPQTRVDRPGDAPTEGSPSEGSPTEDAPSAASRSEGSRSEGSRSERLRSEMRSGETPTESSSRTGISSGPSGSSRPGHGTRPGGTSRPGDTSRARPARALGRFTLAAAAAFVLAIAVPGVIAWQQHERAVTAEARAAELTALLSDPDAAIVRSPVAGGGEAVAVLTADRALLLADRLPAAPEGQVYQMWLLRDGVPIPAGFLDVRDGTGQRLADGYTLGDGLAVSVEPTGGSAEPTSEPIVVLVPS
jgi:anti-sigma-K factor RskA